MSDPREIVAVFPLPNVVFFPGTRLPLHIFEPRYSEMVKASIAGSQKIAMFLLRPGWEKDYYGNPPVFPIGCAGELEYVENLPEEKFNILLRGIHRVRVLEEVQENPFRKARVEILPEILEASPDEQSSMRESLVKNYARLQAESSPIQGIDGFTEFVNTLAMTLQLDLETKMELLTQDDVFKRAQTLLQILQRQAALLDWTSRYGHLRPTDPTIN